MLRTEQTISPQDAGVQDAKTRGRGDAGIFLRQVIARCLAIILVLMMTISVRAQVAPQMYGPPTAEQMRDSRMSEVAKLADAVGMSTLPHGEMRQPDVPLPDLTQILPTTTEPTKLSNSLQIVILLSVLTLAPSILLMCTCFTRIIIVLSLLRQAMGVQQLPPNQVMIGLALFMTFLIMSPTWNEINKQAITPYRNNEISQLSAIEKGVGVMREFMIRQIVAAHNEDDVYLFHGYANKDAPQPESWSEVATTSLVPAFILSELKVAFLMGFRIYLPFLIIDMVVSSVLISIGMQLLPPVMVSLPFKLLLFVLVDGWHLVTQTLLMSFN